MSDTKNTKKKSPAGNEIAKDQTSSQEIPEQEKSEISQATAEIEKEN